MANKNKIKDWMKLDRYYMKKNIAVFEIGRWSGARGQ